MGTQLNFGDRIRVTIGFLGLQFTLTELEDMMRCLTVNAKLVLIYNQGGL